MKDESKLRMQIARGRQAEELKPKLEEYLGEIQLEAIQAISRPAISMDHLQASHAMLCVIQALKDRINAEISTAKLAKSELEN